MSNQGNIEVRANNKTLLWTTSRWAGSSTPLFVQTALKLLTLKEPYQMAKDFLSYLPESYTCNGNAFDKCAIGGQPILELGNTDTPTVVVSFDSNRVYWRNDIDTKKPQVIADWDIPSYLFVELLDATKMSPEIRDLINRWYE